MDISYGLRSATSVPNATEWLQALTRQATPRHALDLHRVSGCDSSEFRRQQGAKKEGADQLFLFTLFPPSRIHQKT